MANDYTPNPNSEALFKKLTVKVTAAQPYAGTTKKIDAVFVCNEDGLELHTFSIGQIEAAEAMAESMSKRHQQKFSTKVVNVESGLYPALSASAA